MFTFNTVDESKDSNPDADRSLRQFKESSPLQIYMGYFHPTHKYWKNGKFTYKEIVNDLRDIIAKHKYFDSLNPHIIIGSPAFGKALGARALHVNQIQKFITQQLVDIAPEDKSMNGNLTVTVKLSWLQRAKNGNGE